MPDPFEGLEIGKEGVLIDKNNYILPVQPKREDISLDPGNKEVSNHPASLERTMGEDTGSKFDEGILPKTNLQDYRAEHQPEWMKFGAVLTHALADFGSSYAGSNPYVVGAAALTSSDMDSFLTNPLYQALGFLNEKIKEATPIYKSQEESQVDSVGDYLTSPHQVMDDLGSGLGFLFGGILSAKATNALLTNSKGISDLIRKTNLSKLGASTPGELAALGVTNADDLASLAKFQNTIKSMGPVASTVLGRVGESYMEAEQTHDDVLAKTGDANLAREARDNNFWFNMALGGIDYYQNLKLFNTFGHQVEKKVANQAMDLVQQGAEDLSRGKKYSNIIGQAFKGFISEGEEEGLQWASDKAAKESAGKGTDAFIDSLKQNYGESFTDTQGQISRLLGGVLGAGGGVHGGVGDNREVSEKAKEFSALLKANQIDENANTIDQNSIYKKVQTPEGTKNIINNEYLQNLNTFSELEKVKENAIQLNDKNLYDFATDLQLYNKVVAHLKTNTYDDFVDELKVLGESSGPELKKSLAVTKLQENAFGIEVTPKQEVEQKLKKANEIKNIYNQISSDYVFNQLSDLGKKAIVDNVIQQKAVTDQVRLLNEELVPLESRLKFDKSLEGTPEQKYFDLSPVEKDHVKDLKALRKVLSDVNETLIGQYQDWRDPKIASKKDNELNENSLQAHADLAKKEAEKKALVQEEEFKSIKAIDFTNKSAEEITKVKEQYKDNPKVNSFLDNIINQRNTKSKLLEIDLKEFGGNKLSTEESNIKTEDNITSLISSVNTDIEDTPIPPTDKDSSVLKDINTRDLAHENEQTNITALSTIEGVQRSSTNQFEHLTKIEDGKLVFPKVNGHSIILRDEQDNPIKTGQEKEFDFKYINDPTTLLPGTEVRLSVWDDSDYSKSFDYEKEDAWKDVHIKIEGPKDNGTFARVTQLRNYKEVEQILSPSEQISADAAGEGMNSLEALRKQVLSQYKEYKEGNNTSPFVVSTVEDKTPGFVLTDGKTHSLTEYGDITLIKTNNIGVGQLSSGKQFKGRPGAIYGSILRADGEPFPMRMFGRKLSEAEADRIIEVLPELQTNYKEASTIIEKLIYIKKVTNFEGNTFRAVSIEKNGLVYDVKIDKLTKEDLLNLYHNVTYNLLNSEANYTDAFGNEYPRGYNDYLGRVDALWSDVNPNQSFYNSFISLDPMSLNPFAGLPTETEESSMAKEEEVTPEAKEEPKITVEEKAVEITNTKKKKPRPSTNNPAFFNINSPKGLQTFEERKIWLQERFSNLSVETMDMFNSIYDSGGLNAWGVFYDGAIYLSSDAAIGTEYHEAFHAAFREATTDKEKSLLYKEAAGIFVKPTSEDLERLKKGISPETTTEELVELYYEEAMAEEFRKIVTTNGNYKVKGPVGAFLSRLWNFIKSILGKKISLDDFYSNIEKGVYQNTKFTRSIDIPAYLTPTGFTPAEKTRRINSINYDLWNTLSILEKRGYIASRFDLEAIGQNRLKKIYKHLKYKYERQITTYEGQEPLQKVLDDWDTFVSMSKKSFKKYGYDITSDTENDSEVEIVKMEGSEQIYDKPAFEDSAKDTLSREVKLYLHFVPKVGDNGELVLDDIGNATFEDFDKVYSYLGYNLTDLDSFEDMIQEMKELSEVKPWVKSLVTDLTSASATDRFKNKFYIAFSKNLMNFLTMTSTGQEGNRSFKIFETNRRSLAQKIRDEWREDYLEKFAKFDSKTGKVTIDDIRAKQLNLRADKVLKEIIAKGLSENNKRELLELLGEIGVKIDPKAFDLASKEETFIKNFITGSQSIPVIFNSLAKDIDIFSVTGAKGELTILNKLSNIEKTARIDDATASFINGEGNAVHSISMNTAISKKFNSVKGEDYKEVIENYFKDPHKTKNYLLESLYNSPEVRENFKWFVFDTERPEVAGISGTPYSEMSDPLWLKTKVNMMLNGGAKYGLFSFPTPADKGNTYFLRLPKQVVETDMEGNLKGESFQKLHDMFMQEVYSIKQAYRDFDTLETKQLIKNYHYNSTPSKRDGNGLKFNIFRDFNDGEALSLFEEGRLIDNVNLEVTKITEGLQKWFKSKVEKNISDLKDNGIIEENNGRLVPLEIDKQGLSKYGGVKEFISEYTLNTILGYNGITALTISNPAFFKSVKDITKRIALWQTPGTDIGNDGYSNIVVVKDVIVDDEELYEDLLEGLTKSGTSKEIATKLLSPYRKTNQTDAQGYTTIERHIDIMKRQGAWGKNEIAAYQDIITGNPTEASLRLILQPVKGLYSGQREIIYDNGTKKIVPFVVKYSTVPLIPIVTKDFPILDKIRLDLETTGNHELVFDSAWKIGPQGVGRVDEVSSWNPISVSNSDFRIPQVVPYKEKFPLMGTQVRKNIISNIDLEGDYNLSGEKLTGRELVTEYNRLISENIVEDYNTTMSKLKLDHFDAASDLRSQSVDSPLQAEELNNKANKLEKQANEAIKKILISEIDRRNNLPDNYEKSLQVKEDGKFMIPLDFPTYSRKFQNLLTSTFKKGVTLQRFPGSSNVQVSNFGYSLQKEGKLFSKEGKKLKEFMDFQMDDLQFVRPIIEDGKFISVAEAEVYVSKDYFRNVLADRGITEDFELDSIPEDLRYFIAYRIPNQGKNSMLICKIKDFLPKELGAQIVFPAQITTQMGSDFDIDKAYLMNYHFEVSKEGDKKIKKAEYGDEGTRDERDNRLLDIFFSILKDPKHFREMVQPNSVTNLEAVLGELEQKGVNPDWYDESYKNYERIINQAGKQLVGIYSTKAVIRPIMQILNPALSGIYAKFNGKVYNSVSGKVDDEGTLITENNAELQNAAVDNANTPILGQLNDNIYIAPVRSLLSDLGVNLRISSYFFKQVAITEFNKKYSAGGGTPQAAKKALEELRLAFISDKEEGTISYIEDIETDVQDISIEELKKNFSDPSDKTFQRKVLNNFILYKEMSDSYDKAVKALGADTTGAGPTLADMEVWINRYFDAMESNRVDISQAQIMPELSMIKMFTMRGIIDPFNSLSKIFSYNTPSFTKVKGKISGLFGRSLNAEQINALNYFIYQYGFTQFSQTSPIYMTQSQKEEMLEGDKSISNRLKTFKNYETSQKEKDPSYEFNKFTESLFVDQVNGIDIVKFNSSASRNQDELTTLSDDWLGLYNESRTKGLAEDLMKFTMNFYGFTKTSDGFSELVPVEMINSIGLDKWYEDFKSSLSNPDLIEDSQSTVGEAIDLWARNPIGYNSGLIPTIKVKRRQMTNAKVLNDTDVQVNALSSPEFAIKDAMGNFIFKPYIKLYKYEERNAVGRVVTPARTIIYALKSRTSTIAIYTETGTLGASNLIEMYNKSIFNKGNVAPKATDQDKFIAEGVLPLLQLDDNTTKEIEDKYKDCK